MDDSIINIKTHAIKVTQRPKEARSDDDFIKEHDFFIMSLPSSAILNIAKFTSRKDSLAGIQREHKDERDKEIGKFITSDNPFFPNSIILNIPLKYKTSFFNSESNVLNFSIPKESAYVIDGQHRLKAFKSSYSKGTSLDLVVAAYFGLELSTMAEIFTRINYFQKPVSKSLVYDLLDINTDPEFSKYVEAHEVVKNLNEKLGSPFYGLIKMLGVGRGVISQAAVVEALVSRYNIFKLLDRYDASKKQIIISNYYNSIKSTFPDKWGNDESILSRSMGFNALTKVFASIIIKNCKNNEMDKFSFKEYSNAIKTIDVDDETIRHFGGFKGVNALAASFEKKMINKGLL